MSESKRKRLEELLSEMRSIIYELGDDNEQESGEVFKPGDKVRLKDEFKRHSGDFGPTTDGERGLIGVHGNDVLEIEKIADCGEKAYFKHEKNPWCPVFWLEKVEVLDADGAEIRVGDTVYSPMHGNVRCTVIGIDFETDGFLVEVENEIGHRFRLIADDLAHTQPDTWGRLEEDAKKSSYEYWGCEGIMCGKCPEVLKKGRAMPKKRYGTETCVEAKCIDILHRAKVLADLERFE